ncbi:hypothetical protein L1049_015440 [Liquidambar formosana]|uniref:Pentatricopeptide repeat-containing protein n=1 Tax=Liquidambar formosana TaxID=63359 RepID=A0AAP0X1W1_LIQFO
MVDSKERGKRNPLSYNSGESQMVHESHWAERIDEAMEFLKEMKEIECRADFITFNVILGGLCRQGGFEEALGMLERLPYEGVYLKKASYRIVLNFLFKEGEMEKATELLGLMLGRGFLPHFATSNELLVCLYEAGKADDAARVLFGLVEMGFNRSPIHGLLWLS